MTSIDARKAALRDRCWAALETSGDARPPGTRGRIPNFAGAYDAARRLAEDPRFRAAAVIKCNPDTPQAHVRLAALEAGKTLLMAVPRLAGEAPFLRLDGRSLSAAQRREAADRRGMTRLAAPVRVEALSRVDLIISGCVGVTREGARLGKGGGYADLEFALLAALGAIEPDVPVFTTVHPTQLLENGAIPMNDHDVTLDAVFTPLGRIACSRGRARPRGIDPRLLTDERASAMPPVARHLAREPKRDDT